MFQKENRMTATTTIATSPPHKSWPWTRILRYAVQTAFVGVILSSAIRHHIAGGDTSPIPSLDALCPFGGVETAYRYVVQGQFVPKTAISNLVLLGGLLLTILFAGGSFCGWICPFGAIQDVLNGIRRRLKIPTVNVPSKIDHWLTFGRYVVLALILYFTISTAALWFLNVDPYHGLFGLGWIFEFDWAAHGTTYAATAVIVLASVFIPRFWCRYLCPLGGVISILQRFSLLKIERRPDVCIDCGRCAKACPMRLPVDKAIRTSTSCIGCLECVDSCPKKGALDVSFVLVRPKAGTTTTSGKIAT
jgi:polyferredoxin